MQANVSGVKIAQVPRRTCDTYPPTIKKTVRGNARMALTTTLEVNVITEVVQTLRRTPHVPVERKQQGLTHAQGKIWTLAHGVEGLAVVTPLRLAAGAITNQETSASAVQLANIPRVGQLRLVRRVRVANTVLHYQARVVRVLQVNILRRGHQAVQPCRVNTLRLPVGHVLRRRGKRATRRSRRMRRAPRRATARASARRGTFAAHRRPGSQSLTPVRRRPQGTLWRTQAAHRRRPVLLARTRGARGKRPARWRPSGTMFRARQKRRRRRVARGRSRTRGGKARARHARGQTLRRERATCAATRTRRARTRRRRTTPP